MQIFIYYKEIRYFGVSISHHFLSHWTEHQSIQVGFVLFSALQTSLEVFYTELLCGDVNWVFGIDEKNFGDFSLRQVV